MDVLATTEPLRVSTYDFDVVVLGGELQAAVAAALSRPDLQFLFLSTRDVVDGWDLPNVSIRHSQNKVLCRANVKLAPSSLLLCPTWLVALEQPPEAAALTTTLSRLGGPLSETVLPVTSRPPPG